ncbi:MAG: cytochrome c oxidase assembly protein [Amylibacter sp.]|nr:cytochrome c oxidase assembly protein [Amylibacter sp.]
MSESSKNRIAFRLLFLVAFMLAMSFAAVPFYDWFCRVTGFGGVTQKAVEESDVILDRKITVRFDGSLDSNIDWKFKPVQRTMTLHIGETGLAFYEAHNPTDRVIAGTASFNVYPYSAGYYFNKIQCFCFEMQVLQPGETVQMPVTFFVDPEIINDREAKFVKNITLSYTFHATDLPTEQASLASTMQTKVNKP